MATAREKVERELQSLVLTDAEVARLKQKLLDLSEATETVRIGRDEAGIIYGDRPNLPVQLAATVKLLEFGIGKPRQAVEITQRGGGAPAPRLSRAELAGLLADNPGLVTAFLAGLKGAVEMKQVVDVAATSESGPARLAESQSDGSPTTDAPT